MKAIDLAGHVVIFKTNGYEVVGENSSFKLCVELGFEFNFEQLAKAVNNKTIRDFLL